MPNNVEENIKYFRTDDLFMCNKCSHKSRFLVKVTPSNGETLYTPLAVKCESCRQESKVYNNYSPLMGGIINA